MRGHNLILIIFLSSVVAIFFLWQNILAQEDTYEIAHKDIFKQLERQPVLFPHMLHEDALSDQGCGICHHTIDEDTGQLTYVDGEEQECKNCHGIRASSNMGNDPDEYNKYALREAFHLSCTGCHRKMKKNHEIPSGPTTCGECHKK